MQIAAFAPQQFNNRQTDRVRPPRRSRGKHAMFAIVKRRGTQEFEALGPIKFPKNKQMRKAFNVGETGGKFWQDLEPTLRVVLGAKTFGNFTGYFVGAANKSDWAKR